MTAVSWTVHETLPRRLRSEQGLLSHDPCPRHGRCVGDTSAHGSRRVRPGLAPTGPDRRAHRRRLHQGVRRARPGTLAKRPALEQALDYLREGGPKFKTPPTRARQARATYDSGEHTVQEIADTFGVSRPTT